METGVEVKQRLISLDTLRGFDMFWIIGGKNLVLGLLVLLRFNSSIINAVEKELSHVGWDGFNMFDLIFPLFMFMSGVSMAYSIIHKKNKGVSTKLLHLKSLKRLFWLVLIGLSFTLFKFQLEKIKLYNVLFLIGMGNYIGGLIIIYKKKTISQLCWAIGILIGYYLATYLIPYPNSVFGELLPGNHLAGFLDQNLIPSPMYMHVFDPEGTIRVIPASVMCVLGALIGKHIKSYKEASLRCAIEVFLIGIFTMLIGWLFSFFFPIIKSIWSSSFILYTAGISMIFLSLFYLVIDVYKQRWLGFFFIPIGMNSILIYTAIVYVNFRYTANYFFKGLGTFLGGDWEPFLTAFGVVLFEWLLLYFLYKKRIFLKV